MHNALFSQYLIFQEHYSDLKYVNNEGSIYCLWLLQCWLLWPGSRRESLLRYSLEYDTGFCIVFTHSSRTQPLFFSVLVLCHQCKTRPVLTRAAHIQDPWKPTNWLVLQRSGWDLALVFSPGKNYILDKRNSPHFSPAFFLYATMHKRQLLLSDLSIFLIKSLISKKTGVQITFSIQSQNLITAFSFFHH